MLRTVPFLVAMNLVPLLGVMFWGWDLLVVLLAFWAETAVVGLFAILKMLMARGTDRGKPNLPFVARLLFVPFFCLHFGGFMAVHGVFVVALGGAGSSIKGSGFLRAAPELALASPDVRYFLVAAVIHHGVSFAVHFLRGGERDQHGPMYYTMQPYGRVIVQHVAILFGAFGAMAVGSGVPVLVLLVAIKTSVDVITHLRSHRNTPAAVAVP